MSTMLSSYPGTPHHQALLAQIVRHYKDDSRILAVCLFGSLVRGNWDQYSDLDLDIVVEDGIEITIEAELQNLCIAFEPLGETALIVVSDGNDSGDIVLKSLAELSVRYHPLKTTSPNIIDNLELLTGRIDLEAIKAAGMANLKPRRSISDHDVDRFLRWAIEVQIALHRRQFWQAARLLQFMRETVIDIFAISRGYPRVYHAFESTASESIKARIGATFPKYSLESIHDVLLLMLDILEDEIQVLSNGQLQLTDIQHGLIVKIREV